MLLPGKMHMENLKKGDIILNAKQTSDLLKYGKTNSHARAYAEGTVTLNNKPLSNAYYTGAGTSNGPSLGGNKNLKDDTTAQKDNTTATKDNTSATQDNTESSEDFTETIDWVAERLQYFADRTKRIADTITDYISFAFKERQLKRQFNSIDTEIAVNQKAQNTYLKKANSVKLSAEWKKKVQQGDYVIEDIKDKNLAENIKKYQEYYDKAKDCESAVLSLQAEQRKVFEDLMNIPTEKAERKIDKLSKAIGSLNNAYDNMSGGSYTAAYLKQLEKDKNTQLKDVSTKKQTADNEYKEARKLYNNAKENSTNAKLNLASSEVNLSLTISSLNSTVKKNKDKLTQGQIDSINKAISNGTKINTKNLSGKVLEWAKKYNADIDAKNKAIYELDSAEKFQAMAQSEFIDTKANKANVDIEYQAAENGLSDVQKNIDDFKDNKTFVNQNKLLDQQLEQTKKINKERQQALKDTSKNLAEQKKIRDASKESRDASSKSILKNFDGELSKAQKAAIQSGNIIDTTGIKNEKLKKQLEKYNELVREYSLNCQDYTTALEAQEEAANNASDSQAEYVQMMIDNEIKKFENIQTFYESLGGLNATLAESYSTDRSLKESLGEDTSIDDFEKEIIELQEQKAIADESVSELRKQLQKSVDSRIIIEGSEEWIQMTQGILEAEMEAENLHMDVLELQDTMRNEVFYRELNKALEKSEELRNSLSSISNLINDEMMFDDDGMYTDFGVTALATGIKEYESYLGSMETLLEKREAFIKAYNNDDNNTNYNQKEFEADMANIEEEIRNMLSNTNSARQAIIGIILDQSKAELDATIKVIDAREELLKKQKEYYDYDKTLKNKTKDLQLLDQQIAALDGVADAESRAQKARLEAERMELREELDETVKDHRYEMHIAGLDDLKTELQDNYDNYAKELNQNLEVIVSTVANTTDSINGCLNTVNETIKQLLGSFNIEKLTTESIGVPQYASGSKYIKKTTKSLVNESGQEIIVTKMGTFMPLSYGDGVVPADLTAKLFSMAQNYPNFTPNIVIPEMTSGVNETIAPVIHCPITIMGNASEADITAALKKNLPYITKSVQNEIRKDLRKSGR